MRRTTWDVSAVLVRLHCRKIAEHALLQHFVRQHFGREPLDLCLNKGCSVNNHSGLCKLSAVEKTFSYCLGIATAKAEPAALPWQDAPPICKSTIKLVCDATHGWSRTSHWLHHGKVREAVFAVLVVGLRVERRAALLAETAADEADADATAVLPSEMWIFMMRFFMRSWWKV